MRQATVYVHVILSPVLRCVSGSIQYKLMLMLTFRMCDISFLSLICIRSLLSSVPFTLQLTLDLWRAGAESSSLLQTWPMPTGCSDKLSFLFFWSHPVTSVS